MFIIGLTGGIGSGKSTIAEHFSALGVPCIDADQTARDVVQPGEPALTAITQHFGPEVIQPDGTLDRRQVREKIFADPAAREWLNNLLHPLIRQRMVQQCQQAQGPYCILMVPLLFENHLQSLVHRTLVIDIDEATQIRRTMLRDNTTEEQVKAIIAAQCPRQQRLALADDVIQNGDEVTATQRQQAVYALHQTYLQLAAQHQSHG
ncbi:dephospho-CoA kinase [Tolumonas auensis DSM 9187]|uniref:Dephospho-CoA kinase n=1 Tax=Tolumonas auensis (strain DSM 9187 / NBRC 110442 / TA 4) TaxID=595494 RepID=C4LA35_TOLAT|nr:dephospho-CoA kinase [Tolumonas auensis]ACQ92164.1 dephospho-CoA kinase [Tolumonas auensis DSM 9187]